MAAREPRLDLKGADVSAPGFDATRRVEESGDVLLHSKPGCWAPASRLAIYPASDYILLLKIYV